MLRARKGPPPSLRRAGRRRQNASVGAITDPVESAHAAGLRYVSDSGPGIRRKRLGRGFRYIAPDGSPLRDRQDLQRIKALAIPPAWTEVWICPAAQGHIQASGRDAKGRKQYRYHPLWRAFRDDTKYRRMIMFGDLLPTIRRRVDEDLALPGLPRQRILATLVRLLDETRIRIGNDEYERANHSYGLTTLRGDHVKVQGERLRFRFRGKGGKVYTVEVKDRRVAHIVRRCQDLPGHELFQYLDDEGHPHPIASDDVNDYLRQISGRDITAKDFRTWSGTVLAARALKERGASDGETHTETRTKQTIAEAIRVTARQLGNTPAICRKSYVHPGVLDAYRTGALFQAAAQGEGPMRESTPPDSLDDDERAVLDLLRCLDEQAASTHEMAG